MKTKHTQSEWILNTQIDMELYKVVDLLVFTYENNDKSKPFAICRIHGESTEEGQANAKLVAAAPQLLQACLMLIHQAEISNYHSSNGLHALLDNLAIREMRLAIKKATE
jgi:hypothetical protein